MTMADIEKHSICVLILYYEWGRKMNGDWVNEMMIEYPRVVLS